MTVTRRSSVASNSYNSTYASCPTTANLGTCELDRIAAGESIGTNGIRVFASPDRDWVATRPIWNQHTYHITNVSETGEIPRLERANWSVPGLNNFRLNVQPGATNLPDPVPVDLAVDLTQCSEALVLNFRIENRGWSAVPIGTPVGVYVFDGSMFNLLTTATTTRVLLPGESEPFTATFDLGGREPTETVRFRVVANDGGATILECRPANNQAEVSGSCDFFF